jgi:hypothetical protein
VGQHAEHRGLVSGLVARRRGIDPDSRRDIGDARVVILRGELSL